MNDFQFQRYVPKRIYLYLANNCQKKCKNNDNCDAWTFFKKQFKCSLFSAEDIESKEEHPKAISGSRKCSVAPTFTDLDKNATRSGKSDHNHYFVIKLNFDL